MTPDKRILVAESWLRQSSADSQLEVLFMRNGSILANACVALALVAIFLAAWLKTFLTLDAIEAAAAVLFVAGAFVRGRTVNGRLVLIHARVRKGHSFRRSGE